MSERTPKHIKISVAPNGLSRIEIDGVEQTNVTRIDVTLRPYDADVTVIYEHVELTVEGDLRFVKERTEEYKSDRW